MKKLLTVLAVLLVVGLAGCSGEQETETIIEEEYYTQDQVDSMFEDLGTSPLVEWKYNHYFDMFQIRVHEDETKVNWISIEVYQVDGVGEVSLIRHMENSDTVEEYYELDLNYPLQTDYYSLTLYIVDLLQSESYNKVLYGLE
jgi:hypothetical protein